ncbi:OVARIAN TUMOR DOMAIN-containing deubiquitinating enzyme 11 (OTU domain-containing protein 11) (Deubiquitinating enzyme OTU11), partial [Durusdinium trenchii]
MGNAESTSGGGAKRDAAGVTRSRRDLHASSELLDELVGTLGCPEEVAVHLVEEHQGDERQVVLALARAVNSEEHGGKVSSKSSPKLTDKFRRSVHFKEIHQVRALGFPEAETISALRQARYHVVPAVKILLRDKFHKRLLQASGEASGTPKTSAQLPPPPPPPIRERADHAERMLQQLKGCKTAGWNPTLIRAVSKLKLNAKRARAGSPSNTPQGDADAAGEPPASQAAPQAAPSQAARRDKPDVTLLRQRLENFGLAELVMEADGNCQFRSVSFELYGSQAFHAHVRARAIGYIKGHMEEFSMFFETPQELRAYIREMSADRTWGDELTLKAISEAFSTVIHVLTSTKGFGGFFLEYMPRSASDEHDMLKPHAFMTYLSPVHYNVMTLRDCPLRRKTSKQAIHFLQQHLSSTSSITSASSNSKLASRPPSTTITTGSSDPSRKP